MSILHNYVEKKQQRLVGYVLVMNPLVIPGNNVRVNKHYRNTFYITGLLFWVYTLLVYLHFPTQRCEK